MTDIVLEHHNIIIKDYKFMKYTFKSESKSDRYAIPDWALVEVASGVLQENRIVMPNNVRTLAKYIHK